MDIKPASILSQPLVDASSTNPEIAQQEGVTPGQVREEGASNLERASETNIRAQDTDRKTMLGEFRMNGQMRQAELDAMLAKQSQTDAASNDPVDRRNENYQGGPPVSAGQMNDLVNEMSNGGNGGMAIAFSILTSVSEAPADEAIKVADPERPGSDRTGGRTSSKPDLNK